MIFQEATHSRRLVGRLDEGDDCLEALETLCSDEDVRAGEVRGVGRFGRAEVVRHQPDSGDYTSVLAGEGTFDLVHFRGNVARMGGEVALRAEVVLAVQGPAGPQVVPGKLQSARVVEFEFVLDVFADLEIERQLDTETGLLRVGAIRRVEEAGEASEGGDVSAGRSMDWEDAVEQSDVAGAQSSGSDSAKTDRGSDDEPAGEEETADDIYGDVDFDEPGIASGDLLEHPEFGRCRVIRVETGEALHVRLPRGKIRKLSLEYLEIEYEGEENSRNVFAAEVRT